MYDPSMIQRLADVRQQEILEQAAALRAGVPYAPWRDRLGRALIAVGMKLARLNADDNYASAQPARGLRGDA